MAVILDDDHLMMIEPKNNATPPIDDEITKIAKFLWAGSSPNSNIRYRGFHRCVCGETSDNQEWRLPNGKVTNSLLVHYVESHRDEIPSEELEKLKHAA